MGGMSYNGMNQNQSYYAHQQRKLSYSPILTKPTGAPYMNQSRQDPVGHRRALSKLENYQGGL